MADATPRARRGTGGDDDTRVAGLLRLAGSRPAAPAEAEARVEAAVRAHWRRTVAGRTAGRRRRRRVAWAAWAAGAATAALALLAGRGGPPAGPSANPAAVGEVVAVHGAVTVEDAVGGRRALAAGARLATGSTVVTGDDGLLAVRTAAGVSVRLAPASRTVWGDPERLELTGGALYVDSPPGAAGPLIVAGGATLRELGTRFEIRLLRSPGTRPAAGAVRLRVRDGAVRLSRGGRSWTATAGQELTARGDGTASRLPVPGHGEPWSWTLAAAPPLPLDGRPLGRVLADYARETGLEVTWADPALRLALEPERVFGPAGGVPPAAVPERVLPAYGLRASAAGGTLRLEELP